MLVMFLVWAMTAMLVMLVMFVVLFVISHMILLISIFLCCRFSVEGASTESRKQATSKLFLHTPKLLSSKIAHVLLMLELFAILPHLPSSMFASMNSLYVHCGMRLLSPLRYCSAGLLFGALSFGCGWLQLRASP